MSLPGSRISNYDKKLIPLRVVEFLTANKPAMVESFGAWALIQAQLLDDIKLVLIEEGIGPIWWPKYYSFGLQVLQHLALCGTSYVESEIAILVTKWTSRNCSDPVLIHILLDVFTITWPPP